jgi:hypothetical protein
MNNDFSDRIVVFLQRRICDPGNARAKFVSKAGTLYESLQCYFPDSVHEVICGKVRGQALGSTCSRGTDLEHWRCSVCDNHRPL